MGREGGEEGGREGGEEGDAESHHARRHTVQARALPENLDRGDLKLARIIDDAELDLCASVDLGAGLQANHTSQWPPSLVCSAHVCVCVCVVN